MQSTFQSETYIYCHSNFSSSSSIYQLTLHFQTGTLRLSWVTHTFHPPLPAPSCPVLSCLISSYLILSIPHNLLSLLYPNLVWLYLYLYSNLYIIFHNLPISLSKRFESNYFVFHFDDTILVVLVRFIVCQKPVQFSAVQFSPVQLDSDHLIWYSYFFFSFILYLLYILHLCACLNQPIDQPYPTLSRPFLLVRIQSNNCIV